MTYEVFSKVLKAVNDDSSLNANNVVEKINQEFERKLNELYRTYSNNRKHIDNRYKYTQLKEEHEKWKKDGSPLDCLVNVAAEDGYKNVLIAMVGAGANINGLLNYTTLHRAVEHRNIDMINFLLDNGADINAKDATTDKSTPLCIAVGKSRPIYFECSFSAEHQKHIKNYEEIAKLLIDRGADVNESDPLDEAVSPVGNINLIKLLVQNGAIIFDHHLHGAANYGNTNIAEFLIDNGADVNSKNAGSTSLHRAARNSRVETMHLLIKKGANVNELNNSGQTPLHIAASLWGNEETILTLVRNGADPWIEDKHGCTAMDYYLRNCTRGTREYDQNSYLVRLSQAYNQDLFIRYSTMLMYPFSGVAK